MKLIITEKKGMADALAKAAGNFEEEVFDYRCDDDTIVWTDGLAVDLAYRPAEATGNIEDMTSEEIVKTFYKPVVRNGTEDCPGLTARDHSRLAIIERELEMCDEAIFVTPPTDDSVRFVQAILAFFHPEVPCRHVRLQYLDRIDVEEILEGYTHTPILERHLTDSAMRRLLKWDMEQYAVKDTEHKLTPLAVSLLDYIHRLEKYNAHIYRKKDGNEERSYKCHTLLGLEDLQGIMWAKYGLYPFQLNHALDYLFHNGWISAPFTHCSSHPSHELAKFMDVEMSWEEYAIQMRWHELAWVGAIIPLGKQNDELLAVEYNPDRDEDNPYKVAAMLYSYILNHTKTILTYGDPEEIPICAYNEFHTVAITDILNTHNLNNAVPGSSEHFIESRTIGELLDQLIQAELIDPYGDSVCLNELGVSYLDSIHE